MEYQEQAPPASLQRHVQCLWRLRAEQPALPVQTVYPDGRCELIVHLGVPMSRFSLAEGWQVQARCLFAAQLRSAIRLAANGPVDCVGVRLQPAASHAIVGNALPGLVEQVIDLAQAQPRLAPRFQAACIDYAAGDDPAAIWRVLHEPLTGPALDVQVEAALSRIDAAGGDLSMAGLVREQRIGLRSLQSRFLRSVGLTAKEYARVQRLQATLRQLDEGAEPLSALALERGFADQAHATREVARLTGLTPARLRRALQAERVGDATLRMAAAFVRGRALQTAPAADAAPAIELAAGLGAGSAR